MTKVTVATLKADYVAALAKIKSVAAGNWIPLPNTAEFELAMEDARRKRTIWQIARKQGLEAAMLWKLAN
ncbi:hypothetical protein DM806_20195 [Sphingobium lactosutens]|uniref:hypothetical protein n=1 Tax=Sphingobium lactosutens TaxID=522773 RepID=UPI0015BAF584|nr:hypothetical protein [Sphingobium lactosutens]NWK97937.1 hypothetical protein [Sphingobium lactosutens]